MLAAVLTLLAPAAGSAQEAEPPEGAMLIILDASGSMNSVDEADVPYIDKAKEAILELVDALPDGMLVGLRVYGHREPNTDPVRGCQDSELVSPVAPIDRDGFRDAIERIEASGFTPIGLSLQEAVADLPETGPRSIVLISDGEDTCAPPDPCQVAEELFGDLLDVRIESVGFLVGSGSAAEQQLRCIADVTGGHYTSVNEPNALVASLGEVTDELLDWRPPLTLNGALDQVAAPAIPLSPKADWVTDEPGKIAVLNSFRGILMPGETRWYQLDLWERESFWVWSDLEWPHDLEA
jgi:Ca-activated chloride channel family protein